MKQRVPYLDLAAQMRPLRSEIDAAIAKTLDACAFCLGPGVEQFEQDFARVSGSAHVVGVNSGTSALHLAMRLLDIGPGDEVITTPFTFVATSWAIVYAGARPVYVDIDESTFNLDPAKVERAISPRTKAVLPVHLFGHPCDLDPLADLCHSRNLAIVEDAAQAHGAIYWGKPVGTIGVLGAYSFYPGKNLGAYGEGGALVTNDSALAARARALRDHGSTRRYYHDEIGYNYRMDGIQGAVLGVKLRHLREWSEQRRRVAARYIKSLRNTPLVLPCQAGYAQHAWHLFVVRHPEREALKQHLEANGIGCGLHYPLPLHLQQCFSWLGYRNGDFPVAERIARECLSLPIYPELSDDQIQLVADVIAGYFK